MKITDSDREGRIGTCSYPGGVTRPDRPPVGEVALLFTDVEGSTTKARALGGDWGWVLARHNELLRTAIEACDGWWDGSQGDGVFATFADPRAAAAAAVAAQRAIRTELWPAQVGAMRVRMGLHVGMLERADVGYFGLEIHRAARVADCGPWWPAPGDRGGPRGRGRTPSNSTTLACIGSRTFRRRSICTAP